MQRVTVLLIVPVGIEMGQAASEAVSEATTFNRTSWN